MAIILASERLGQETASSRLAWTQKKGEGERDKGGREKGQREEGREEGMEEKKRGLERVKNRAEEIAQSVKGLLGKHESLGLSHRSRI